MLTLRLVLAVAVAACSSNAAPAAPSGPECAVDADCALVGGVPPDCCSRCGRTAMPAARALDVGATCAKKRGDYFKRCPHLRCTCQRETARCQAGTCTVETKGCNP